MSLTPVFFFGTPYWKCCDTTRLVRGIIQFKLKKETSSSTSSHGNCPHRAQSVIRRPPLATRAQNLCIRLFGLLHHCILLCVIELFNLSYTYVDIENVYNLLSLILHELTDITILLVRSLSLQIWFKFPYVAEIRNRHFSNFQKWRPRKANRNIWCKQNASSLFFQEHVDTPVTSTNVDARRNKTRVLQRLPFSVSLFCAGEPI